MSAWVLLRVDWSIHPFNQLIAVIVYAVELRAKRLEAECTSFRAGPLTAFLERCALVTKVSPKAVGPFPVACRVLSVGPKGDPEAIHRVAEKHDNAWHWRPHTVDSGYVGRDVEVDGDHMLLGLYEAVVQLIGLVEARHLMLGRRVRPTAYAIACGECVEV